MGIVYLAKDPLIGRLVALKTIRVSSGVDEEEAREFQQRFVREAQAAGILSHPAIVTVHDIGQDPESGSSFIAMEYVEGKNLKELLNQGRKLTFEEVADIVAQIAEALDYAHSKGIIHRDVKPANIIICENGQAKIMDFGIAKIASSANLTTTGQFLGTPNYMAPEQIRGAAVDGRTDLFSLGVVLYEALARRKPFGGDSLTSISYKIVHEPFVPLRDVDPDTPAGLDEIVNRCLQKNAEGRYQRGRELASDLRRAVRGEFETLGTAGDHEETWMTQGPAGKLPTVELPFPDADDSTTAGGRSPVVAPAAAAPASVSLPQVPPALKQPVSPGVFYGVVLALLLTVGGISAWLWSQRETIPPVDTKRQELVDRQRQLRTEGAELLRSGDIEGAYRKFVELRDLAPNSPEVARVVRSIESIRLARMSYQQRTGLAQQRFDEARRLYDAGEFNQAIPLFEEAAALDPTSEQAANYLKMSQDQLKLQHLRSNESASRTAGGARGDATNVAASGSTSGDAASTAPVTLLTTFDSPVTDGYILIKADGETIVHENIWEERRGFFRRKSPKQIAVYSQIPINTSTLDVWVVVPSLKIQEHRSIHPNLQRQVLNRLTISLDADARKVTADIS